MTVPSYEELMQPMLRLIAEGRTTISECEPFIVAQFGLSTEDQELLLPSGKQTRLRNRMHWARQYLSQAGLVEPIKRGHYRTTERGTILLKKGLTAINNQTLEQFVEFRNFRSRSNRTLIDEIVVEGEEKEARSTRTPEDTITEAFKEIESALAAELISAVLNLSTLRFEQLIVDLLIAMGYGGGDRAMGERLGKSGDGGIDGVVNEDKLGLDAVYVQAKRYSPGNTVGRPTLQAFVGSLTGEGATKGVFVTTSDFSREAREYLNRVQHRIVLINGEQLARLLIQHEVGVRARQVFTIRSVDEDYFDDD